MPEYLAPGVNVEETSFRSRAIEGVNTATAAFIGETEKRVDRVARLVTSYEEFERHFGKPLTDRHLAHSVRLFFDNGGTRAYIAPVTVQAGSDLNETAYQDAFGLLDAIDEIALIAVPGVGTQSMVEFASEFCRKRGDCFFIADLPPSIDTAAAAHRSAQGWRNRSTYAAQYFPWLRINSRHTRSQLTVPPSGAVAGIYARTDATRGVWKAPAGRQANLRGVIGLAVSVSNREQGLLNPLGLNVIRDNILPDTVLWGARTMAGSDPEYRYVPVRRTAIFIEESIKKGTQWSVFEPNDQRLWTRLQQTISDFMDRLFRQGALAGATPDQAYVVKCDHETTTQADINNGIVNCQMGFAPLKPAEFVILKIQQKTAQRP